MKGTLYTFTIEIFCARQENLIDDNLLYIVLNIRKRRRLHDLALLKIIVFLNRNVCALLQVALGQ